MARVASQRAAAAKFCFIDVVHHQHHGSSRALARNIVREAIPVLQTFRNVAIHTIQPQRCSEESHRIHELIDGNSFEDLHILEDLFGHERFLCGLLCNPLRESLRLLHGLLSCLLRRCCHAHDRRDDSEDDSAAELHVCSLLYRTTPPAGSRTRLLNWSTSSAGAQMSSKRPDHPSMDLIVPFSSLRNFFVWLFHGAV